MSEKALKKLKGGGGGTVVLMIGLYLIILAFFILLNAISESSQTNYEKASNSLKTAFGFTAGELEENEEKINITIEEFYEGIAKKISGVISSYFAAEEFDVSIRSGRLKISIPTYEFFDGTDITVNPMVYSFIFDFVQIINNISNGSEINIEVNMEMEDNSNSKIILAESLKNNSLRASDITSAILKENAAAESVFGSVKVGKKDMVNIYVNIQINDYQKAVNSYKDYLQD